MQLAAVLKAPKVKMEKPIVASVEMSIKRRHSARQQLLFSRALKFLAGFVAVKLLIELFSDAFQPHLVFTHVAMLVVFPVLLRLSKRGHYVAASISLLMVCFAALTVGIFNLSTMRSLAAGYFGALVLLAGLLLGRRAFIIATVASFAAMGLLAFADTVGVLEATPRDVWYMEWIVSGALLIFVGALTNAALALITQALTRAERAKEEAHESAVQLRRALLNVKELSGLLPVCAWCRRVRDDEGYWSQLEHYIADNTRAQITHGICPDCQQENFRRPSCAKVG